MPAPKMLAGLPKPVLFGLYGAVGGLIGALFFGELIWYALKPAQAKTTADPQLAVTAAKDLQIYQKGTNRLGVKIARELFDEEVTVRVEGLPSGVTAAAATVPAKQTDVDIELQAAPDVVPVTQHKLKVVATAKAGGKELSATFEPVSLTVSELPMPEADVVFVLDVTNSMTAQIRGLQQGIGTFATELRKAKVNARFGCVCFRDLAFNTGRGIPAMDPLRFKGAEFTDSAKDFSDAVGRQEARASQDNDYAESSFEALAEAAKYQEWRKSATRVLILITDAPPRCDTIGLRRPGSSAGPSEKETANVLQENKIDLLHLVTGTDWPELLRQLPNVNEHMLGYFRRAREGVVGVTGKDGKLSRGEEFDLPTVAQTPELMANTLLPQMSQAIAVAAEAKRPDAKPEVSKPPEAPAIKGVQSSDSYDASAKGQLILAVGVWTGAIAALVCLFLLSGQHHYLRGTLPAAGGILAGLGGGLLVGVIGGAMGQGLFLLAPDAKILAIIFRVMGWTILGSMAGAGLSLFVPNLKPVYGLAGGAIGGAVGAMGYIAVEAVAGAFLGRLAGGLVLGLFIGLMVAVVEAAFRRAWLEVQYGPREKVTVNLGAEPVKIGSNAQVCTVWARGAAEVELRYFIRNGKVICTDVPSKDEMEVSDGDTREAGNVTVVVRTGAGKADDDDDRPRKKRAAPPPPPRAKPQQQALSLDDDYDDGLPMPVSPPPPPAKPQAAPPPAPPARSTAPPRPAAPAAPPRPPAGTPAIKSAAKDPNACPSCGRKVNGSPGARYCMVCDQTF